jgi:hypothetical protein
MSLWTPGGEHPVDRNRPATADDEPATDSTQRSAPNILDGLTEEQRADFERLSPEEQEQAKLLIAQMAESRRRMAETPAATIVANHAMGLYELAAIHLSAEQPNLSEAKVAIDAMAALIDAVGTEMGEDGQTLQDALAQIRLAFVQIKASVEGDAASPDSSGD